jgi:hypothetical protein
MIFLVEPVIKPEYYVVPLIVVAVVMTYIILFVIKVLERKLSKRDGKQEKRAPHYESSEFVE